MFGGFTCVLNPFFFLSRLYPFHEAANGKIFRKRPRLDKANIKTWADMNKKKHSETAYLHQ